MPLESRRARVVLFDTDKIQPRDLSSGEVLDWLARIPLPEALALAWRYSYGVRFVIVEASTVLDLVRKQREQERRDEEGGTPDE